VKLLLLDRYLHLISTIAIFSAAIIPIYISIKIKTGNKTEIDAILNVDQATFSRDIKVLKQMSQQFIFDLAKSDLAYYYKSCIAGIEAVKRRAWEIADSNRSDSQQL
jgi:hypothetical protein